MNSRETVLLTGFGPFGKFQVNASWESVRLLNNYENDKYRIITHEIPVEYDQVDNRIPKLWTDLTPKLVIHVGVSEYAQALTLECTANRAGYEKQDAAGKLNPTSECCKPLEAPDVISTKLDVQKINQLINNGNCSIKTCVSKNCGRYLCEYIFYKSLSIDESRTMFIHVPPLGKPYTAREIADGILRIVELAMEMIGCSDCCNENASLTLE